MPPKNVDSLEIVKFVDGSDREVFIGNENEGIFDVIDENELSNDLLSDVAEISVKIPEERKEEIRDALGITDIDEIYQRFACISYLLRESLNRFFKVAVRSAIKQYPDKKAVHLALHSKKWRVRKKYADIIVAHILKEGKKDV